MRNKKLKQSPAAQTAQATIKINSKWRDAVQQLTLDPQFSASENSTLKSVVAALTAFVSNDTPTLESQTANVRAIAHALTTIRSSKSATPEDNNFLTRLVANAIIPICAAAFFCDAEQSARTALLAIFSRIQEVEATIISLDSTSYAQPVNLSAVLKATFETNLLSFLASEISGLQSNHIPDYARISRACLIVSNTIEWSLGVGVIHRRLEDTVLAFAHLLSQIKTDVESTRDDALLLSQKTRACHDILKTLASLFAKLQGPTSETNAFAFLAPNGFCSKDAQLLLTNAIQITFSDPSVYVRDCQFMAGIVLGWVLELTSIKKGGMKDRPWIEQVFFDGTSNGNTESTNLLLNAVNTASVNLEGNYSLLCFMYGLLSTIGTECAAIEYGNISLVTKMYNLIMKVIQEATESTTRVFAFQTLALWMSVLKDSLVQGRPVPSGVNVLSVFKTSFELIFTFWEDPVDSTHHKLKDLFIAMLEIINFFRSSENTVQGFHSEGKFLFEIVDNLLKADWLRKVKYDLLAHLLAVIRPEEILKLRPDFLTVCFDVMSNLSMSSRICAFLIRFFAAMFDNPVSLEEPSNLIWLNPFCYAVSHSSVNLRRAVSENLLGLVFKEKKLHFDLLLSAFESGSHPAINSDFHIHGSICVLKTGRSLGFMDNNFLEREATKEVVHVAISHPDSIIRMDVCALLCESARAIAEPTDIELQFVKRFLSVNGGDHRSEFRQKLFGNVHKLIVRIRKCLYANQRDLKVKESFVANNLGDDAKLDETKSIVLELKSRIELKMKFLTWLIDFAVISLSPGCSFPRTTSALVLLTTIRDAEEVSLDSTFNKSLSSEFSVFNNPSCASALMSILLNDTYEPSRQSSFNLLKSMKGDIPGFGDAEIQSFLGRGLKMLFSVKASDADGGAFVFRLIFSKYVIQGKRTFKVSEDYAAINTSYNPPIAFVYQLLSLLTKNIEVNERQLSESITDFTMHGLFGAIRAVVGEVQFSSLKDSNDIKAWKAVLLKVFELVHRATKCVLVVLSDESPEGNYPGLNEGESGEDADVIMADSGGDKTSKSQRILHECFRTVKEACGAMETILCKPPLPTSMTKQDEILDFETILNGGNWLRMLLTTIRHYGAFSGVFPCFQTLCTVLLSSKKPFLVTLPQSWLDEFLLNAEIVDVSITRRSGGLPLGVLAVLGSPSVYRSSMVDQTMNRLFKMAKAIVPLNANTNLDLPQVHAFNIIRRLLQDATITDLMRNYFAECFVLSIDGLSSTSFPIRNCATMLFSALVTKVIGVKKSRDQDHVINTVSGREFFARFPSLHSFMMQKLAFAVSQLQGENHTVHPAFYPILTILARLKPTTLEANTSHLTLVTFRPLVEECASSSFFKVREVTSRAYASLISSSEFVETIGRLMSDLNPLIPNELHGKLMIVRNLLETHLYRETPSKDAVLDLQSRLPSVISTSLWILSKCSVSAIQDVYIDILKAIFVTGSSLFSLPANVSKSVWVAAVELHSQSNREPTKKCHAWTFNLRRNLTSYILECMEQLHESSKTKVVMHLLNDSDYEVQLQALNYLKTADNVALHWGVILPKLVALVHDKSSYEQVVYTAAKISTLPHIQPFFNFADVSLHSSAVVSVGEDFAERVAMSENTYEVEAILPLLTLLVTTGPKDAVADGIRVLIGLFRKWSSEETAVYVRLSVTKSLSLVLPVVQEMFPNTILHVDLILLLDILLNDDDSDVRSNTAEVVCNHFHCKPMIPIQCRSFLLGHVRKIASDSESSQKVTEYALGMLFGEVDAAQFNTPLLNAIAKFKEVNSHPPGQGDVDAVINLERTSKLATVHNPILKVMMLKRPPLAGIS
ncbi:hypothetical protein HDU79_003734, partial [Rhizoclosmatium sp. JEL0117]